MMTKVFHPEELALLTAIHAEPSEDTPRLVYADWLDEHGQPNRAEFIRIQCELANLPELDMTAIVAGSPTHADYITGRCAQCSALPHPCHYHALGSRAQELLAGLFPEMAKYKLSLEGTEESGTATVRRGFVESVVDSAEGWAGLADAIFAEHPVTKLQLTTWPHMHWDSRKEGDDMATYLRLEGRERWHPMDSLDGLAKEGPYLILRQLLAAEWPIVEEWNLTAPPPSDAEGGGIKFWMQVNGARLSHEEVKARLLAHDRQNESFPHRILRGIRWLFEAD